MLFNRELNVKIWFNELGKLVKMIQKCLEDAKLRKFTMRRRINKNKSVNKRIDNDLRLVKSNKIFIYLTAKRETSMNGV